MLLLGVKLDANHSHCAPLTNKDVEVLGMEVQQSWNSQEVADFMEKQLEHHNQIDLRYVISDRGSALLAAFNMLGLSAVSDCTHMMMNIIKKLFKDNAALAELCAQIGQLRRRLILTKDSFILPPTLRDKDRFLRIFTIVDWARRFVQRALALTRQTDLQHWHQNYTCDNRYSLIQRLNTELKNVA